MDLIVAVTKNWGIGKDGKLLMSIPDDMKYFREKTKGAVVLMGRNTLESFPNGKPLKGRVNVVLTRNSDYSVDDALIVHSKKEAFDAIEEYSKDTPAFVIGGECVYKTFLPYCRYAYITKMGVMIEADSFFPDLDKDASWVIESESSISYYKDTPYRFIRYENINLKRDF